MCTDAWRLQQQEGEFWFSLTVCLWSISKAAPRILILHIALWSDKRSCSWLAHASHAHFYNTQTHMHNHTLSLHTIHHTGICPFKDELHSRSSVCLSPFRLHPHIQLLNILKQALSSLLSSIQKKKKFSLLLFHSHLPRAHVLSFHAFCSCGQWSHLCSCIHSHKQVFRRGRPIRQHITKECDWTVTADRDISAPVC